jgi:hypothetical protein
VEMSAAVEIFSCEGVYVEISLRAERQLNFRVTVYDQYRQFAGQNASDQYMG